MNPENIARLITEDPDKDATESLADDVVIAIDAFLGALKSGKWPSTGQHGAGTVGDVAAVWSVQFAGGDDITRDLLDDEDFIEFLGDQFPMSYSVFGHAAGDKISLSVRFNPLMTNEYENMTGEDFRRSVESTIDHELGHLTLGDIPRRLNPTGAQYSRMPDELHANISAMAAAYKRNKHMTLDDLLNVLSDKAKQYYNTPKWRKIILRGLARRGTTV